MPAECALDIDELPRYSHSTAYDPREWLGHGPIFPKRPRHDGWPLPNVALSDASRAFEATYHGRVLTERVEHVLRAEIERARAMIKNRGDEEEDDPSFSEESLSRATAFLRAQSAQFRKMLGSFAPVPNIGPGPDGSVDLHWKREGWELLVNIPADADQLATFYGDDYGAQKIRGSFDPKTFNYGIITWLMNS